MAALTFYSDVSSLINHQFHCFSSEFSPDHLFYLPDHPPQLVVPDPVFDYVPAVVDHSAAPFFHDDASSSFYFDEFVPVSAEFFPYHPFEFRCHERVTLEQSFNVGGCGNGGGYFPPPPPPELFSCPWDRVIDDSEMINNHGGYLKTTTQPSPPPPLQPPNSNLSAQTIAARERRRKITAKTQELGELVPGGSKMNTAEMLSSAFKYVKFLQAQVSILQLQQETEQEEEEEGTEDDDLHEILESKIIQEKLYSQQKCLVPRGLLQTLANSPEIIQSHPSIIDQILQTSSTEQMQK